MFGSTQKETTALSEAEQQAMRDRAKTATITGCSIEIQIMKQQMNGMREQFNKVVGLVTTLQGRLEAINDARVRELQGRGHGPTEG